MKVIFYVTLILLGLHSFSMNAQTESNENHSCNAPHHLRVERESSNVLWLEWEGNTAQYEINYSYDGGESDINFVVSGNKHAIVGYRNDRIYHVKLRSICSDGSKSAFINLRHGNYNPCETPITLNHRSINPETVALTWNNASNAGFYTAEYRIRGSVNNIRSLQTARNEVVLSDLLPNTEYEFQVSSVCNNNSVSVPAKYYFNTLPNISCMTPVGVHTRGYDLNSVWVGWNPVAGAVAYDVRWQLNSTTTWTEARTWNNSMIVSNLMQGVNYRFQVRAVCSLNGTNISDWSPVYFAQTLPPTYPVQSCLTPTRTRVQIINNNSALLSWNGATEAVSYEILSSTDGQNYSLHSVTGNTSITLNDLSPFRYWVKIRTICANSQRSSESIPLMFRMGLWGRGMGSLADVSKFVLYPNPTKGEINIVWNQEPIQGILTITDLSGKSIINHSINLQYGINSFDFSETVQGIYFLSIKTENSIHQQKLILE